MKNLNKRGGKGMLPTCCLLLRGREGSPSQLLQRISELQEKENFNKAEIVYYSPLITYRPAASGSCCSRKLS